MIGYICLNTEILIIAGISGKRIVLVFPLKLIQISLKFEIDEKQVNYFRMKNKTNRTMAAIFCLFSVALCKFSGNDLIENTNHLNINDNDVKQDHLPLSAQIITVPRVYISPCPESFRYTFNGKEWFGLVVIGKPAPRGIPSRLKIVLSVGFHLSSVSFRLVCGSLKYNHRISRFLIYFLIVISLIKSS
jgi:hypothetical protein